MAVEVQVSGDQAGLIEYLEGKRDAHREVAGSARLKGEQDRHTYRAEGLDEAIAVLRSWHNTGAAAS